jgi:hypothetical protein
MQAGFQSFDIVHHRLFLTLAIASDCFNSLLATAIKATFFDFPLST